MHSEKKSHLQHYSQIYHRKEQPNGLFQHVKRERCRASRGGKKEPGFFGQILFIHF